MCINGCRDKNTQNSHFKGFTLVELSIVLVMIGFLVGSVIAGTGLVESSRIISQARELNAYTTAFNAFVVKYAEMPGDMVDASSYWSTATNGDGNGRINANGDNADLTTNETYTIFQHLSYAGLIPGSYNNTTTLGVGYPKLKLNPGFGMISGYMEQCCAGYGANSQQSDAETTAVHSVVLYLNVCNPSAILTGGYNDGCAVMTPLQAQAIDTKIDDGIPYTGNFIGHKGWANPTDCLTAISGSYLKTNTLSCSAFYVLK